MSKDREYFINPKGTWIKVTDLIKQDKPETHVHVIEISALSKLNQQLELTKAFLEAALGDCKDAEVAEEMAGNYKKAMGEVEDEAILDRKGEGHPCSHQWTTNERNQSCQICGVYK